MEAKYCTCEPPWVCETRRERSICITSWTADTIHVLTNKREVSIEQLHKELRSWYQRNKYLKGNKRSMELGNLLLFDDSSVGIAMENITY